MEVQLTADQQASLRNLSLQTGRTTDELMREAISLLLVEDESFRKDVQHGIEQLDRGEFIDQDEMDERVRQLLRS